MDANAIIGILIVCIFVALLVLAPVFYFFRTLIFGYRDELVSTA